MKMKLVFLAAIMAGCAVALKPPDRSYKILMLLPSSSKSHRNVFLPLAEALTQRGHQVTMLSNHEAPSNYPGINFLTHGLPYFDSDNIDAFEMLVEPKKDMFALFKELFPKIARELYTVPQVKELYNKRNEFDLFIIDSMFNEATYPFVHERPFITIGPGALDPSTSAIMGNLQNPAYVSNFLDTYPKPFTFINRMKNVFFSVVVPIMWRSSIVGSTQIEISKMFPDIPSLVELERNQSLHLFNSHFSLMQPQALLPNQVEVGGMHLRPAKPLPKDLESFLSGKTPVIYFSLGSVAKAANMPVRSKEILLSAFAKLDYKVLWKYEEEFPNLPKNIMIKKWMPQQDILGHPNVKVFISHCGLLGTQESIYNSKPMLGLPIFGDQPKNAKTMEYEGFGRWLSWADLSEELIIDNLKELVENPRYRQKAEKMGKAFRDQLSTPTDRAVYWTEYVIRHNGAPHLRSPEMDLTWIQLLHLDTIFLLHVIVYCIYRLISKLFSLCCGKGGNKKRSKNKRD